MDNYENFIKETIETMLNFIGVNAGVIISQDTDGTYLVDLSGDDLGVLIGYHGDGLSSLQTLIGLILSKKAGAFVPLRIDINGYKRAREDKIVDIAKNAVDKVRFTLRPVELSPMNASERRLVHTEVSKFSDVASESVGEGYSRRVVVKPKE